MATVTESHKIKVRCLRCGQYEEVDRTSRVGEIAVPQEHLYGGEVIVSGYQHGCIFDAVCPNRHSIVIEAKTKLGQKLLFRMESGLNHSGKPELTTRECPYCP